MKCAFPGCKADGEAWYHQRICFEHAKAACAAVGAAGLDFASWPAKVEFVANWLKSVKAPGTARPAGSSQAQENEAAKPGTPAPFAKGHSGGTP